MDTKSGQDDSAGSDSLDKSLQQKCVVNDNEDELGHGDESCSAQSATSTESDSVTDLKSATRLGKDCDELNVKAKDDSGDKTNVEISKTQTKTDGSAASGSGAGDASGSSTSASAAASAAAAACSSSSSSVSRSAGAQRCIQNDNLSGINFETKVTQISNELKETTLAETETGSGSGSETVSDATDVASVRTGDSTPSSSTTLSSSSSSSSSSSLSTLSATPDEESHSTLENVTNVKETTCNSSMNPSANDSVDDLDGRSKKVRFHPDVKENDGGNRVKKKKMKLKNNAPNADGLVADECDAMELDAEDADDDEDDDEYEEYEEEEFDLAKTIAEADDYLREHPLTFVRASDQSGERLKDGLLDVEDMPQLAESSEDEDVYANTPSENGVQRVLGKQTKSGKIEFLLRYVDRPGLHWEPEEYLRTHCPTLLTLYEKNREKQQERLMRHVAKRQNLRQRYTDF